jgi:predicted amidophosphoribosyltransferase
MSWPAESLAALLDLLLPADCPGCGAGQPACAECLAGLHGPPLRSQAGPVPVWSVAEYGDRTARLVRAWKDGGRHDLGRPLAAALGAALLAGWQDCGAPPGALLVPVPSGRANRRRRGADLVTVLARRAVDGLRRDGAAGPDDLRVLPVLRHRRRVADQAGLGVAQRAGNLHGALGVPIGRERLVAGRTCLPVDDVLTTGATLAEAARALSCAGAAVPAAAVLARTPRHAGC